MTENTIDYSVEAVKRAAKAVGAEIASIEPDLIRLICRAPSRFLSRGYDIELRRSQSGLWFAAWLQECGTTFLAYTRNKELGHIYNCYAYSPNLDDLISADVRAYSTPAVAIRSIAKRSWYLTHPPKVLIMPGWTGPRHSENVRPAALAA